MGMWRGPQIFLPVFAFPLPPPPLRFWGASAISLQGSHPVSNSDSPPPSSIPTIAPLSKSSFLLRHRGQTESTSPESLRTGCPNCNTPPSSLLPKLCVSLGSSAVFSLVVFWAFSLLVFQAASLLIVSFLLSLWRRGNAPNLFDLLISTPEDQPGMSVLWDVTPPPCSGDIWCSSRLGWKYHEQGVVRSQCPGLGCIQGRLALTPAQSGTAPHGSTSPPGSESQPGSAGSSPGEVYLPWVVCSGARHTLSTA